MADEPRGNERLIEAWAFTNDADRLGSTGYFAQDIGKLGYQQDTGQYWRLTSAFPITWQAATSTEIVASGPPNYEAVFADEDGDFVYVG